MDKYQEALTMMAVAIKLAYTFDNEEVPKPVIESTTLLQELVNKRKPMKVIQKPVKHYINYYCPCCNRKLSSKTTYYFCPKKDCGQALDWSDR